MNKTQTAILASIAAMVVVGAILLLGGDLNSASGVDQTSTFSSDKGVGSQLGSATKVIVEVDSPYGHEIISSFKIVYTDNLIKKEGYTTLRLIGPMMRDKTTLLTWVEADLRSIPLGLSTKMGLVSGGNKPVDMTTAPANANITKVPMRGTVKVQLLESSEDMYTSNSLRELEFSSCHVAGYWVGTYFDDRKQIFKDGVQYVEEINFACTKVNDLSNINDGSRLLSEIHMNGDAGKVVNEKGELITTREYRQPIVIESFKEQENNSTPIRKEIVARAELDDSRYDVGQQATFTVSFTDLVGVYIEPDKIKALYDGQTVELEVESLGVYTFTTPSLTKAHHQLIVSAEKDGFATDTTYLSIPIDRVS